MRYKTIAITIIIALICLSCAKNNIEYNNDTNYQEFTLSEIVHGSTEYLGLLENNMLIYFSSQDKQLNYYMYNLATQKNVKLGNIKGNYVLVDSAAMLNNKLYFYVTTILNNGFENILYTVDLQEHKLEQIEHKDNSLYGVYTFSFGEKIIALKNERYNDTIVTYIDTYSPTIDKWEKYLINSYNETERKGSALYVCCTEGEYLYTIEDRYNNKQCKSFLVTYDSDFEEKNNILLSDEVKKFIDENRITEIRIWNNFFYLKNISNDGFIGYIKDNKKIEKIYSDKQLSISSSANSTDEPIFYIRDTNTFFTLDIKNQKVLKHYAREPYEFLWIITSSDAAVFDINKNGKGTQQIYVKRWNLEEI